MQTVLAFLVAIGLLVAVHEWGHFYVARLCGVKVLRFSIGFGPKLWGFTSQRTGTEFVLSAVPLGGYVKMLDGREGPVADHDQHQAFDCQSLKRRSAIVVAGPLGNLLLAIGLYAFVNWQVVPQAAALLPTPVAGSMAAKAGWSGGERVSAVGLSRDGLEPIQTFEELRWWLTQASVEKQRIYLHVVEHQAAQELGTVRSLDFNGLDGSAADASLFQKIGWLAPFSAPVIGDVSAEVDEPGVPAAMAAHTITLGYNASAEGRAAEAGLHSGDLVLSVDGVPMGDAYQLRALIRQSPEVLMHWRVLRGGREWLLSVRPKAEKQGADKVGRVGAYIGAMPQMVDIQYGFTAGLVRAVQKTWEISRMSLLAMGQMVTGQVSLRNLNGPLAIADYAGKSAALGSPHFISFLALISISLGVLNLLPLPVLDGGHLMYYLWEGVTGHPVPEKWWELLQRAGTALLLVMMSIAFYNDVLHIWG